MMAMIFTIQWCKEQKEGKKQVSKDRQTDRQTDRRKRCRRDDKMPDLWHKPGD
jgi:hypothetical protein